MRLTDIYYTKQTLDGTPEPPANPIPIEFYQGEDIVFDVYLNYCGKPVDINEWDIIAKVKSNVFARCTIWEADYNNGIFGTDIAGFYRILYPSELTSSLINGTYWLDVMIHQKSGKLRDMDVVIMRQPFSISYSTLSPNPGDAIDRVDLEKTVPPATSADTD